MKRQFGHWIAVISTIVLIGTSPSCSKSAFNPPEGFEPESVAKTTVTSWEQEETFYNECCGEEITLNYTLNVVENANGFHISSSGVKGYGHTTGSIYHGVIHQGGTFQPNHSNMVFTTVLANKDCGLKMTAHFHTTCDTQGNVIVSKDSFSYDCLGNE